MPLLVIDRSLNEAKPVLVLNVTVEFNEFKVPLEPHLSNDNKDKDADHLKFFHEMFFTEINVRLSTIEMVMLK